MWGPPYLLVTPERILITAEEKFGGFSSTESSSSNPLHTAFSIPEKMPVFIHPLVLHYSSRDSKHAEQKSVAATSCDALESKVMRSAAIDDRFSTSEVGYCASEVRRRSGNESFQSHGSHNISPPPRCVVATAKGFQSSDSKSYSPLAISQPSLIPFIISQSSHDICLISPSFRNVCQPCKPSPTTPSSSSSSPPSTYASPGPSLDIPSAHGLLGH